MNSRRPEVTSDGRTFDEFGADPETSQRLAFGPFILEPETGRLLEGDRIIPLAPKPFETLHYLASRPGRVVAKSALIETLWPDTFVTDDVLVQCVVEIRRALGDHAKTPQYVQTIPRKGYQFLATVRALGSKAATIVPEPVADSAPALVPTAPRRWPAVAAAVVVVLVAGLTLWRWSRPAASALPAEPGSLVVMPVLVEEPTPQSGWLRHGVAEMIRSQLGQTPGLHIMARHRLAAALADAGYDEERGPTPHAAADIARRLRAERLVTGSFVRVGDSFLVNAQLTDVASGRTLGTASVRGKLPGELLGAVDDLCLKLLDAMRPGPRPSGQAWRPARVATQSIEAYRHYVEAASLFARGGKEGAEKAEQQLDAALKLDPSFAQAYVKKAEIQHWRQQWGYGDPDPVPAVRAAARLGRDLPERDLLLIQSFEALLDRKQPAAALKNWNALLQFYPTYAEEIGVPGLIAEASMRQGRWDDVILIGEAHADSLSLPDTDKAQLSSLLAQAFRRRGEFERALEHARRAVRLWPSREGPSFLSQRTILGRMSLDGGRRDDALAEFRAVAAAPEADATNLTNAAWGLYMAGEGDAATALVTRAVGLDASYGNAYHLRGWLELTRQQYAAAAASLTEAFERTTKSFGSPHQGIVSGDLAALYYAGVAFQKLGDTRHAQQTFERLIAQCRALQQPATEHGAPGWQAASFLARASARLGRPGSEPPRLQGDDTTYFVQSARLHAVQDKREQALRELSQGLALGHGEHRHIRDDPDFESLRNDPAFQRLAGG